MKYKKKYIYIYNLFYDSFQSNIWFSFSLTWCTKITKCKTEIKIYKNYTDMDIKNSN